MSQLMDLPVELAAAPFDPVGKSVAKVVDQVARALRRTEIEPEWVSIANYMDDPNEKQYGLRPATEWPATFARRHRISLSVERGTSEGWIIQADFVRVVDEADGGGWQSIPLMRIKSLSRSQAWTVAAIVARLLDID
ncbi:MULTISPECIES: hypothetical protein [Paraburkholderia]|uniref:Uncharacterized protein n=1 Tax=Paraburkholderia madseniana TaxID=2599607 RepID=A0AAP5BNG5_9BURK|nr:MULTISPECIES: hypothetical protein [Paraburkholderia]MCX4152289.1 hypothetical protein [Paraburkholderia madseniana]MDN7155218.1 hypothetical protein [Paraburkholderia sp. WS6]MDQ6414101.1 hypothetical protein [Paraburkholderia madseniana]